MKYSLEITQHHIKKDFEKFLKGVEFITVPDNPFGRPGPGSVSSAFLLKQKYGKNTVATINTRDRNKIGIISEILSSIILDLSGLFVVSGDNVKKGIEVREISVFQLISLIKKYRYEYGSQLLIGATINLSRENELRIVKRKMESGADFFITQSVYDENLILKNKWIGHLSVPVYAGFMPLLSKSMLNFYSRNFSITTELLKKLENSSNLIEENLKLLKRIIRNTCDIVEGYHIMPLGNEKFLNNFLEVIKVC
ncbi:MAG: methylenetetrahydrofolate reductase [Thermoplasmata archaeon]